MVDAIAFIVNIIYVIKLLPTLSQTLKTMRQSFIIVFIFFYTGTFLTFLGLHIAKNLQTIKSHVAVESKQIA